MNKIFKIFILLFPNLTMADSLNPYSIEYCLNKKDIPPEIKLSNSEYFDSILEIKSEKEVEFTITNTKKSKIIDSLNPKHIPFLIVDINNQRDNVFFTFQAKKFFLDKKKENEKVSLFDLALPGVNFSDLYIAGFETIELKEKLTIPISYYENDRFFENAIILEKNNNEISAKWSNENTNLKIELSNPNKENKLISILNQINIIVNHASVYTFVKVLEEENPRFNDFLTDTFTLSILDKTCKGVNHVSDELYTLEDVEKLDKSTLASNEKNFNIIKNVLLENNLKKPTLMKQTFKGNGIDIIPCKLFGYMIKNSFERGLTNIGLVGYTSYEQALLIPPTETARIKYSFKDKKGEIRLYKRYYKSQNSIDMIDLNCGIKCPPNIISTQKQSKFDLILLPENKINQNELLCFNL